MINHKIFKTCNKMNYFLIFLPYLLLVHFNKMKMNFDFILQITQTYRVFFPDMGPTL